MVLLASPPKDVFMFTKNSAILQANNIKDVIDWMVVKANPPKYVSMITSGKWPEAISSGLRQ